MLFNSCKQNQSCNTGQNIEYLLTLCKVESLNSLIMKKQLIKNGRIYPLKEDEEWLVEMIEEMCLSKLGYIATDIEEKDINTMLDIVCTEWFGAEECGVGVVACGLSLHLIITISLTMLGHRVTLCILSIDN